MSQLQARKHCFLNAGKRVFAWVYRDFQWQEEEEKEGERGIEIKVKINKVKEVEKEIKIEEQG